MRRAVVSGLNPVRFDAGRLAGLGAKQIRSLAENNNRWISYTHPKATSAISSAADHDAPHKVAAAQARNDGP